MCGRFVTASSPALIADRFAVDEVDATVAPDPEPDYNVSPRRNVLVVREQTVEDGESQRVLSRLRWGLVPSWAKEVKIGDRMINARAETVASKPAYRRAFAKKRCLIPADGFYEWKAGRRRRAAAGQEAPRSSRTSSTARTASRWRSPGCGRCGRSRTSLDDLGGGRRLAPVVRDRHDDRRTISWRRSTTACR